MYLFFIIASAITLSVVIKFLIYFFFVEDFDEEHPYSSAINAVMIMIVTSMIPFALGCYVGINYLGTAFT